MNGPRVTLLSTKLLRYLALVATFSAMSQAVFAAARPLTTVTLTVTSGTNAVTTVPWGRVVELTATVHSETTLVTTGIVNFCDASASLCTDIHLLGTAALSSNGTATFPFVPGPGTHSYNAVFLPQRTALGG